MADAPRRWTAGEVAFIERVATETREAMDVIRRQQRERNIAEQLQEALTPPAPPPLPGLLLASHYRPALAEAGVGGDFFDVFPVGDGRTALVVADLSGKGLAAAQQVATVRNMLRFALYNGQAASEAVSRLHHTLVQHSLLTGFATLFVGLYDHAHRTITYVNCGQEPGLIWRAATGEVEQLRPTGPVLGGFGVGAFEQEAVSLRPGDVLALFTDGLTEVGPSRKELLEVEGVGDLLRACCSDAADSDPQAVVDGLITGVDAFARGGLRDDIALLVGVATPTGDAVADRDAVGARQTSR
jgi:sigma-B regulation protein RsbU (phosphoserine phosphatase)